MESTIQEDIKTCRKIYFENVKPYIEKRQYAMASLQMGNMLSLLERRKQDLFYKVHWGVNYLASAQMLERNLRTERLGGEDITKAVEIFEADQAQTKLPLI